MKKAHRIIALILAVLITLPILLTTLSSCDMFSGNDDNSDNGDNDNDDSDNNDSDGDNGDDSGDNGNQQPTKAEYKLTVKTKGGMTLSDVNVYLYVDNGDGWEYEDFLTTDENGEAKVELDVKKTYAYQPDVVKGYKALEYYPVVSANQVIELETEIINESIVGKQLSLGSIMYDFEVTTTSGTKFKVSEMLKTHDAVVLNFWFANCGPCQDEFPFMNTVMGEDKYKDNIALLALSWQDSQDSIAQFKALMGLDNLNMANEAMGSTAGEISSAFGVTGYPTTVVIDRYGVVCLVATGGLPSERSFRIIFDHFIGDNYQQMLVSSLEQITPKEEVDVEMPSRDEIANVFDDGSLGNLNYSGDDEDEYSWPFIIGEKDGVACLRPSNEFVVDSYAQLFFDVELKAGEAIAFDYLSSSEAGYDMLYVIVDGKDIFQISGQSTDWETCYAYVAEADGTYSVALVYVKDGDGDFGEDTVYLKNLRKVASENITGATYIFRYAVKNPDKWGIYQDYVSVVYNENDGYYHVGTADGPLLLANLMGYTRFSDTQTVYDLVMGKSYQNDAIKYCVFASNSEFSGVCTVNRELMEILKKVSKDAGRAESEYLRFCHYFDAYGGAAQLADPIEGLASHSAPDAILSQRGDTDFPNIVNYNRLIIPRGLFKKFTPTESGVYMITSNSNAPVNGWIFTAEGLDDVVGDDTRPIWHEYKLCDRELAGNPDVVSMKVYLEAGVDYYIGVAFYDLYQEGTLQFRIEKLGNAGNGYQLTLASPGPFTYVESTSGEINKIIAGGVDVAFDSDSGYWVEKRTDGQKPSYMYADFTKSTGIFKKGNVDQSITDLINSGAFNFTAADGDFNGKSPNANDLEIMAIIRQHDGSTKEADKYLKNLWGADYERKADEYKLSEIYNGIYHGEGKDFTDEMRGYINRVIKVGDTLPDGTVIAEGDVRIGTVLVDARLGELLQLLMDKEVFNGVETSWRKLCYYDHTFCAETPF